MYLPQNVQRLERLVYYVVFIIGSSQIEDNSYSLRADILEETMEKEDDLLHRISAQGIQSYKLTLPRT